MPHLDRDDVKIFYEVTGSGPVVMFTHGFAATSAMFAANVEALAPDYTVVTWDIRGHGASDYPADPAAYSVPLTLGDMTALLDAVDAERAVLGGHSLGGYLSLEFTVESPGRVAGLILIGTGPGFRNDEARARWNRFAESQSARFREKGLAAMASSEELRSAVHRDGSGLALAAAGIMAQRDARVMDGLASITAPALVVIGENDATFMDGAQHMGRKLPGAQLEVVGGARHAPNVSHPDEFHRTVRPFLATIGSW